MTTRPSLRAGRRMPLAMMAALPLILSGCGQSARDAALEQRIAAAEAKASAAEEKAKRLEAAQLNAPQPAPVEEPPPPDDADLQPDPVDESNPDKVASPDDADQSPEPVQAPQPA